MSDSDRYARQIAFGPIGSAGQKKLASSSVVFAGCGALGSVSASQLVRAGVGRVRLVDRDVIELSNLQRQVLYDEEDCRQRLPKAEAARRKLARVNSQVVIEAAVCDITPDNALGLLEGFDLIIDAVDNAECRYLLNDVAVKTDTPWIYAAVAGARGQTLTVIPGKTPCLRCLFPTPPEPGTVPTAQTDGVIAPVVSVVASAQVAEALKLLTGRVDALRAGLLTVDLWAGTFRTTFTGARTPRVDCPCCGRRRFEFLEGTP
ncbi:MAG TPA: ThiF family adenylyltransferase [Planctomycetota bacterium]|nr:ThiF family adenylyltransferase [Planctomycetota bacterium]